MPYQPTQTDPIAELVAEVDAEVRRGLDPATRDGLAECQANVDYDECRNRAHLPRREAESEADFDRRPKQYARLVRKAVRALAQLYRPGPTRELEGAAVGAEDLLELVYETAKVNALMQRADRHATLNGSVAIQPVPTGKPDRPVALYLWGRHEFVPYFADDDPTTPAVVVTRSVLRRGGKWCRRYQLWTAAEVRTFETKALDQQYDAFWAGTRADRVPGLSGPHPYGVLPFAFAHNELPVESFDGSGIGHAIREANTEVDRMLSDLAEAIEVFGRPRMFGRNLSSAFRWRDRTDGVTHLPPADPDGPPPEIVHAQAQLDVEQSWLHIERVANLTFEHLDVPLKAVRGDHGYEESGIKVLIDRGPILDYLRERQVAWTGYEQALAALILRVLGGWYGIAEASAAAESAELRLSWPAPSFSVPTDEWDRSLQNGLAMGTESLITVIQKREGLTEEQAIERLEAIAEHNRIVERITGLDPYGQPITPENEGKGNEGDVRVQGGEGKGQGEGQGREEEVDDQADDEGEGS